MKFKSKIAGTLDSALILGLTADSVKAFVGNSESNQPNIQYSQSNTYSITDEQYVELLKRNGQYEALML